MFTASPAQSPHRLATNHQQRRKPYGNKVKPGQGMTRSGSILGTIKNIVAAPLSWFSGGERFEDLGKRRRGNGHDAVSDDEEDIGQRTKRMRMDSPPRAQAAEAPTGYLDPPASSLPPITANTRGRANDAPRKSIAEDGYDRSSSVFGGRSLTRTMSIDPPAQYASYTADPLAVPLPMDSPIESRMSMSAGPRDLSMRPSASPLRLRTSLTPQPSPAKPLRREASAPPPLSSLMSKPVFVKPPASNKSTRELKEQKTVSLGSLAEYSRYTRSPSRDRMLTSLSSIPSIPSSLSTSTAFNAPYKSSVEKTFHELEMYKTPIIPSRYKGAKAVPEFLKQQKKAHVPIPMSRKEREDKPSLGMAGKGKWKGKEKPDAKPYAGESRISKLLTKRQLEVEKSGRSVGKGGEEVEEIKEKRDVGVYAKLTSESESDSTRKKTIGINLGSLSTDPFDKKRETSQGGRRQPYGRVGRTRRDAAVRSSLESRPTKSFKFSATFEDDEDDTNMDDEEAVGKVKESPKKPVFEAPVGFTFANNNTTIELDHVGAKEPPISSLPFSLTTLSESTNPPASVLSAKAKTKATESKAPFAPSIFKTPEPMKTAPTEQIKEALQPPQLAVVPPTPEQVTIAKQKAAISSSFFAAPPSAPSMTSPGNISAGPLSTSNGVPNFFANSALLAGANNIGSQSASSVATTGSPFPAAHEGPKTQISSIPTPVVPVKDPDNPLWTSESQLTGAQESGKPSLSVAPDRPRSASPKPPPFGSLNKPSQSPRPVEGQASLQPAFGTTSERSEISTSSSISFFGAPSVSPAAPPTFSPSPTGTTSSDAPSTQPIPSFFPVPHQATEQKAETETEKKTSASSSQFFAFGTTAGSSTHGSTGGATSAPKLSFGSGPGSNSASSQLTTEQKSSSSTFGASHSTSNTSSTETSAPKPFFEGSNVGFNFGASSSTSTTPGPETGRSSPFTFGAPPATPPSGADRKDSFPGFGASASNTGFNFNTPTKPVEPVSTSSPFAFGTPAPAPARPITPPNNGDDHGMRMEESPTRDMNLNGMDKPVESRPTGGITFGSGPTPVNPFTAGPSSTSSSNMFTFGAHPSPTSANPFAASKPDAVNPFTQPKADERPSSPFTFNRVASAPTISTSFSFGQKSDSGTPPTTGFGAHANPFGQPASATATTAPFNFGAPSNPGAMSNPFASSGQTTTSTPGSPFTQSSSFSFGAPASGSNPFAFGNTSSQPASPAGSVSGLPASPATSNATFTFGQSNGSSSGGALFNIGAAPPSSNTPGRMVKKLPRRGATAKR